MLGLLAAVAGCAGPQLGPANSNGLVVIRATVTVQCLKTVYAAPSQGLGTQQSPEIPIPVRTGELRLSPPQATLPGLADATHEPYRLAALGHGAGSMGVGGRGIAARAGGMGFGGHGFTAGAGVYRVEKPPCDDRPPVSKDTDTVGDAWIETDGHRLEARRMENLLVLAQVAPGRYRLSELTYKYFFGDEFHARRLPDRFLSPDRFPNLAFQVEPGQPVYVGTVSIRAVRDSAYHDWVDMSVESDPGAEARAWRELLARYPDSAWARPISERLRSLPN